MPLPASPAAGFPIPAALLDDLPVGVVLVDAAATTLRVNAAERQRSGRTEAEALGHDYFGEVEPVLSGIGELYRAQIATGAVRIDTEARLLAPQGERTVQIRVRSLRAADGLWGIVLIDDRTELTREAERRERTERLAAVGELAAGVAHEVNNPLASIRSFAQLLAREVTNEEQREALELILHETTRVAGVVSNLLSFARKQGAGGREAINLNALTERVLTLQRYALETAGIQVRRDFNASPSPVIGEAGALQQVILNLVVNAEQALSSKQGDRLLILRTRESSEGVILSVVDNGPGIPRDLLPSIFDPFRTTKAEGSGLGLGISAAVVRDHAGHIWAESEEGRGAAFFVRLPRAEIEPPVPAEPLPPVPDSGPARPLRVLVADDEATLRAAIAVFLTRRGHTVVQAPDAYEAERLAREQTFDVALVDARMPGDGLALLERLEGMPALQGRTALMTGDIGRARTQQGITTGRPFLTKPFDLDEMVRLLETLGQ